MLTLKKKKKWKRGVAINHFSRPRAILSRRGFFFLHSGALCLQVCSQEILGSKDSMYIWQQGPHVVSMLQSNGWGAKFTVVV